MSKTRSAVLLCGVLLAGQAWAQSAPPAGVPPPPDLDQPPPAASVGVTAAPAQHRAAPAAALPAPATSTQMLEQTIAPRLPPHDPMGQPPPTVDVRKVKGDTVEEYRAGGKLVMLRIIPAHGPVQTFYAGPDGRLQPDATQGRIPTVMYTLYQWGH